MLARCCRQGRIIDRQPVTGFKFLFFAELESFYVRSPLGRLCFENFGGNCRKIAMKNPADHEFCTQTF